MMSFLKTSQLLLLLTYPAAACCCGLASNQFAPDCSFRESYLKVVWRLASPFSRAVVLNVWKLATQKTEYYTIWWPIYFIQSTATQVLATQNWVVTHLLRNTALEPILLNLFSKELLIYSNKLEFLYRAFHRFGHAKLAYGGLILGSSHF